MKWKCYLIKKKSSVSLNVDSQTRNGKLFRMFNLSRYSECMWEGVGLKWQSVALFWIWVYFLQLNHSRYCFPLNWAVLEALFLVRFLYVRLSAWFGLRDLTASFQRVIVGIGSKNFDSAPSMQIWIKVLKVFFDSEVLPVDSFHQRKYLFEFTIWYCQWK